MVPVEGTLAHLARLALETQRRQQRAQLAAEGLGHVLRAGGEPNVLAGLPTDCSAPTTTTSERVLAGLALRRWYVVTRRTLTTRATASREWRATRGRFAPWRCSSPRCTTGMSPSGRSSPSSAAGACRSSTPPEWSRSTPPSARRSASSTSATSARRWSAAPAPPSTSTPRSATTSARSSPARRSTPCAATTRPAASSTT